MSLTASLHYRIELILGITQPKDVPDICISFEVSGDIRPIIIGEEEKQNRDIQQIYRGFSCPSVSKGKDMMCLDVLLSFPLVTQHTLGLW